MLTCVADQGLAVQHDTEVHPQAAVLQQGGDGAVKLRSM